MIANNSNSNQSNNPYSQNYFGNQTIATPGFIANNFPTSNPNSNEPAGRRRSIIESINPMISEPRTFPSDLLSAFPVCNRLYRWCFLLIVFS